MLLRASAIEFVDAESMDEEPAPIDERLLSKVCELTHVKRLYFGNRPISDSHVCQLTTLPELQSLIIHGSNEPTATFNDTVAKEIAALHTLEYLNLSGTPLTDSGLEHIGKLTNLYLLDVSETKITDASVQRLANLSQLMSLDIEQTEISHEGRKKLGSQLPYCHVGPFFGF